MREINSGTRSIVALMWFAISSTVAGWSRSAISFKNLANLIIVGGKSRRKRINETPSGTICSGFAGGGTGASMTAGSAVGAGIVILASGTRQRSTKFTQNRIQLVAFS